MAQKISSRLEELNLSSEEVERLGNALKQEEFRKLLLDYAKEINDPVNRKEYENEIIQLEKERGVDVKFVHPEPQYVLKTCFNPGGEKVFVNICSNSLVGKPESTPCTNSDGTLGRNWRLPLIQAPPREDVDKSGALCTVYDVLFHPETHRLLAKDRRFRDFVEETAVNAVEETHSVKLHRNSIKRPRMNYKGVPRPTVIRTRCSEEKNDKERVDDDNFIKQFPYPYDIPPEKLKPVRQLKPVNMESKGESDLKESCITPKYTLKQSSDVDMSNYEQKHLSHYGITVPERLVLVVDLPYVKSSSELDLDLEARRVMLCSNGKRRYSLELKLPYPVHETKGTAKFDKDACKLLVTMSVDREKAVIRGPEGDSGIESDLGGGKTSSGDEEDAKYHQADPEVCEQGVTKNSSSAAVENNHGNDKVDLGKEALRDDISINYCVPVGKELAMECQSINEVKENYAFQDFIRPDIPYLMPSFSCSCTRIQENSLVTFVLNVKNVDPCSVKKGVICIKLEGSCVEKSTVQLNGANGSSLPSENGSIRNEYRTVKVESNPSTVRSVNSCDGVNGSFNAVETNRPEDNICLSDVAEIVELKAFNSNMIQPHSSPVHQSDCPQSVLSHSSMVHEENLSDRLKNSLVINESNTSINPSLKDEFAAGGNEIICFFVAFSSIATGYFPQHYSFAVGFPSSEWSEFDADSSDSHPSLEVWDNNVEIQWRKPWKENYKTQKFNCFIGQDLAHLNEYSLPPFEDKDLEMEIHTEQEALSQFVKKVDQEDHGNSSPTNCANSEIGKPTFTTEERRKIFKDRTLSESSVESNPVKQVMKGILKRKGMGRLARSLSESSGGDEYSWVALSSSVSLSPSLSDVNHVDLGQSLKEEEEEYDEDEDDDEEDGEKVKKIVRFSDVISQKTFRSNSSILGQRKKNQRKLRNKKRAAERRASESENSVDEGETDKLDCNSDSSPPCKKEIKTQEEQLNEKSKTKGSTKKKANGNKGKGKRDDQKGSRVVSQNIEMKSDLIFQLEL